MHTRIPSPRAHLRPVPALARPELRLLLTSFVLLFVELLLIRWVPANVRYVGFFSNFLLMASFLGIGLGILLGRRGLRLPLSPFAPLLLVTVFLVYGAQLNIQARDASEIFFGLDASTSADVNFLVLPLLIVLVTALMASLALPLGPLLRSMPPLRAYAVDIGGSMLGIAAFTVLSYLGTGPTAWFVVVGVLLLFLALGAGPTRLSVVGGLAMVVVIGLSAVVAVLPDLCLPARLLTSLDRSSRRTAALFPERRRDPAPADPGFEGSRADVPPSPGVRVVPGSRLRSRPDHRRRIRLRHCTCAGQGRQARGCGRDRPRPGPDRARLPPRGRLQRSPRDGSHQRWTGVPQQHAREVRPDRLRLDRLPDARELDGRRPT